MQNPGPTVSATFRQPPRSDGAAGAALDLAAEARLPTVYGEFSMQAYSDLPDDPMPHLALVADGTDLSGEVLVRIHSECMTGDVFGSLRCDCGDQLAWALRETAREGGVVVYLRQEGRGIGLINKLRAYRLQDDGADTIEANEGLGLPVDARDYSDALEILRRIGIRQVRLMTNNPLKLDAFSGSDVELVERVAIEMPRHEENARYLDTKRDAMGHQLH